MGKSKKSARRDETAWDVSSWRSSKPSAWITLPTCSPILPPSADGRAKRLSGLGAEVAVLTEDAEGDAMMCAQSILTAQECAAWIRWGEGTGFALEKHAASSQVAHRHNGRLAVESAEISNAIFERLQPWVPAEIAGRRIRGCNPNIRLYRYEVGQRFGRHVDQANRLPGGLVTEWTVLLYLNDESLEGGETLFYDSHSAATPLVSFAPRAGAALVHAHGSRCLTHEGAEVRKGVKYLLRTDLAYA